MIFFLLISPVRIFGEGGGASFQFPLPSPRISFLFPNMKLSLFCLSKYRTHEHSILFDADGRTAESGNFVRFYLPGI